jgi:hypothetical protein
MTRLRFALTIAAVLAGAAPVAAQQQPAPAYVECARPHRHSISAAGAVDLGEMV